MKAFVCDRCDAVLKGVEEPYAKVRLHRPEKTYDRQGVMSSGVITPTILEKDVLSFDICSSCEHDVRAFLKKKPDRVNVAARCDDTDCCK